MSRIVIPGIAHHVTQRGNRRLPTFFNVEDYRAYIAEVSRGCQMAEVDVLAYCLMPNHVHLILVPRAADGLRRALAEAHRRYTNRINRRQGWQGHLWQERFHSFPMDDEHLVEAVRYLELNPVRARMVTTPEAWRWSSAAAHVRGQADALVASARAPPLDRVGTWSEFLGQGLADETAEQLRFHQKSGRPLGAPSFIAHLEAVATRRLARRPAGRPRRGGSEESGGAFDQV